MEIALKRSELFSFLLQGTVEKSWFDNQVVDVFSMYLQLTYFIHSFFNLVGAGIPKTLLCKETLLVSISI